jgi:death-on-curing protein
LQNKAVAFLSRDETLEIHRALLERFGGPEGVRDLGLLESALHRPGTGYYKDLAEMAAALFESLIMNHPFVDGCDGCFPAPERIQVKSRCKKRT